MCQNVSSYAERYITFHNEKSPAVPFAPWIEPAWHNCLVGCTLCQRLRPENRQVVKHVTEGCDFDASETGLIMAGTPLDGMPGGLKGKLEEHDLVSMLGEIPRNLAALIKVTEQLIEELPIICLWLTLRAIPGFSAQNAG